VAITVTAVDDAPVASDDSFTIPEDNGPTQLDVLANDTDVDGGRSRSRRSRSPHTARS